jgi:hypothetical protein
MVITHCDFFLKHPPKAKADKKFISRGIGNPVQRSRTKRAAMNLAKMADLIIPKYLAVQRGGALFICLSSQSPGLWVGA